MARRSVRVNLGGRRGDRTVRELALAVRQETRHAGERRDRRQRRDGLERAPAETRGVKVLNHRKYYASSNVRCKGEKEEWQEPAFEVY